MKAINNLINTDYESSSSTYTPVCNLRRLKFECTGNHSSLSKFPFVARLFKTQVRTIVRLEALNTLLLVTQLRRITVGLNTCLLPALKLLPTFNSIRTL